MREQVWFIVSKTDERRYATTRPPAGEWEKKLREEGYSIFRIEFDMPEWWDAVDGVINVGLFHPRCIRCLEPWVRQEICPSCKVVLAKFDLSDRVHARQQEGATELTKEEVRQIIDDVEKKHGVGLR